MCVLVVGVGWSDELPLVVAASRDESRARPSTLPMPDVIDGMHVLLPRDRRAGGTWLGINAAGLIVVVTNRRDGDFEPGRRSRGLLCAEVLAAADVDTAMRRIETRLARERHNSFNLLVSDPAEVRLIEWNGDLQTQRLEPGGHVLSNEHALGELALPELEALGKAPGPILRGGLVAVLGSHQPRDPAGFRICKHGQEYGTVSATILYRRRDSSTLMEHAPGPACTTPFALHRLV